MTVASVQPDEEVVSERVSADGFVDEVQLAPLKDVVLRHERLAQFFPHQLVVSPVLDAVHDFLHSVPVGVVGQVLEVRLHNVRPRLSAPPHPVDEGPSLGVHEDEHVDVQAEDPLHVQQVRVVAAPLLGVGPLPATDVQHGGHHREVVHTCRVWFGLLREQLANRQVVCTCLMLVWVTEHLANRVYTPAEVGLGLLLEQLANRQVVCNYLRWVLVTEHLANRMCTPAEVGLGY